MLKFPNWLLLSAPGRTCRGWYFLANLVVWQVTCAAVQLERRGSKATCWLCICGCYDLPHCFYPGENHGHLVKDQLCQNHIALLHPISSTSSWPWDSSMNKPSQGKVAKVVEAPLAVQPTKLRWIRSRAKFVKAFCFRGMLSNPASTLAQHGPKPQSHHHNNQLKTSSHKHIYTLHHAYQET